MNTIRNSVLVACMLAGTTVAHAVPTSLFDWSFGIDDARYDSFPQTYTSPGGQPEPLESPASTLPAEIDDSAFNYSNGGRTSGGTGSVRFTIDAASAGAGPHTVGLFVDHELNEVDNTFFDEFGTAVGTAAAGQTWEVDKPASDTPPAGYVGDLIDNWFFPFNAAGLPELDNSVFFDAIDNRSLGDVTGATGPVDVAMAMAWTFDLAADETAVVEFFIENALPATNAPSFYLRQHDVGTASPAAVSLYFWGALSITGGPVGVPAPASLPLVAIGLLALSIRRRRAG